MTDRRATPDHAEVPHPLAETGFQTMARYAREILGDARPYVTGAVAFVLVVATMLGLLAIGGGA